MTDTLTAPAGGPAQGSQRDLMAWRDMPPEVAEAVLKVMAEVVTLERTESNPTAQYKFAGIEQFYEAVRPLMADAGLILATEEDSVDFRDITRTVQGDRGPYDRKYTLLVVRWSFQLTAYVAASEEADQDGELKPQEAKSVTWRAPLHRTVMVEASMGSQAFGAAQSYAEKTFLRSLFKIATGDAEELDREPKFNLARGDRAEIAGTGYAPEPDDGFPGDKPFRQDARGGFGDGGQRQAQGGGQAQAGQRQAPAQGRGQDQGGRKSAAQAKRDGDWEALLKSMNIQRRPEELEAWRKGRMKTIEALPVQWQRLLHEKYRDHLAYLEERALGHGEGDPGLPPGETTGPAVEEEDPGLPPGEGGGGGYASASGR